MHDGKKLSISTIGPGILVAATGVGAGDLATATLAGSTLGTAVLWAVLVGAALKFVLNEGLTRWQLATGRTLLEGAVEHLGRPMQWIFMIYLIVWSFLVAMALMSACGVAAYAIVPMFDDPAQGKLVFGIAHSWIAVVLVLLGGYRLFEKVMSACIGLMFVVCCTTAIALLPPLGELTLGMLVPRIPNFSSGGLGWTISLLGGIGGTVTVLCYGYWIREEGREGIEDLRICRIDLGIGYLMTALFGLSMVIIGSQIGKLEGSGATLIVQVADILQTRLGAFGLIAKWAFLFGAWGAVFSSLLGVWQSVPYLFVDFWRLLQSRDGTAPAIEELRKNKLGVSKVAITLRRDDSQATQPSYFSADSKIDSQSKLYRLHLAAIAIIPIAGLYLFNFRSAMKINGMVGAIFIPMLAIVLILLNGNPRHVGKYRNSRTTTALLIATLVLSVLAAGFQLSSTFAGS